MEYTKVNKDTLKLSFNIPINDNKFDIQSDKYLYNGTKTIGFRKDKKLDKFVGLRSGNSKQLEFTIKSIVVDGDEKINTDRLYFNDIKLIDDTIIHKINDIEIYNRIDGSNYRNLVKINDMFDEIEIIYKIDLKGVKINNKSYISNNNKHYLSSSENTFLVTDIGNNNIFFIIDNPIVFTEKNEILNIVQHELYEIDNILYYKKIIRNFLYFNKERNHLPLYVDANIQFNMSNYYTILKSSNRVLLNNEYISNIDNISIWSDFLRYNDNGLYDIQIKSTNLISIGSVTQENDYNIGNDIKLSRHYFTFDTSILSNFGIPTVTSSYFNFYYNTNTIDGNLTLQKSTFVGSKPDDTEWLSFNEDLYKVKNTNINYFSGTTILTVPTPDIKIDDLSKFVLRSYEYDYMRRIPTTELSIPIDNIMVNSSLDVEFNIKLNEPKTLIFNVNDNGFGVLHSSGELYNNVKNGEYVINEHSSSDGTYNFAFGYEYKNSQINLYRTFLSFDTSILGYYNDYNVIKSIKLSFVSYESHRPNVALYKGTQPISYLDSTCWSNIDSYIDTYSVNDVGIKTIINLDKELFNYSGYTKFVMIDDFFDRITTNEINDICIYSNGIDFSTLSLEVVVEPYLVNGLTYRQVLNNEIFNLTVSKNIESGTIVWYDDYYLTNKIGQGNTINLNSSFYKTGDIIYVIIVDNYNKKISSNTLEITLDIITEQFDSLPIYNRDISYDVVDIDSVYFKYENAISGVCYSYFRDLSDVYENTQMVSDSDDTGSYNLYNEFDIIDEFYSNVEEVEVVAKLDDINLNNSYKEIDGQIIHEGTRVLLYSLTPSVNDGIYIADYNLKLKKSSDMTDTEKSFRFKINVNAGTYLDYEFHTYYYDYNEETNNPTNGTFNFDLFNASLYSETVINMNSYTDTIYNSNI